jgi:hypothetical protein
LGFLRSDRENLTITKRVLSEYALCFRSSIRKRDDGVAAYRHPLGIRSVDLDEQLDTDTRDTNANTCNVFVPISDSTPVRELEVLDG